MTELAVVYRAKGEQTLAEAFPDVDPGARPFGDRVLVQLRTPKKTSAGGIVLVEETKDYEKWVTTVGKVIAVGPLAFRDRSTLDQWPEGVWAQIGQFVRVPKHGGDRWEFPLTDGPQPEMARFVIYRDRELIGLITGDPLSFKDYV